MHRDLEAALEMGMDWSLREGYAWAEDKEHCEEYGRMLQADPSKVSQRAKKRGLPQVNKHSPSLGLSVWLSTCMYICSLRLFACMCVYNEPYTCICAVKVITV